MLVLSTQRCMVSVFALLRSGLKIFFLPLKPSGRVGPPRAGVRAGPARTPYLAQAGRSCVRGAPGLHCALGILLPRGTGCGELTIDSSRCPLPPQPHTPMANALAAAGPTDQLKSPSAPLRLSGFFRKR